MRVVLTQREEITGKDGREWRSYQGFAESGKAVRLFMAVNEEHQFGMSENWVNNKETVSGFFGNAEVIANVEYDERGRLVAASKE